MNPISKAEGLHFPSFKGTCQIQSVASIRLTLPGSGRSWYLPCIETTISALGYVFFVISSFLLLLTDMKIHIRWFVTFISIVVALFSRESMLLLLKVRPLWMGGLASVANVSRRLKLSSTSRKCR